MGLDPFVRTFFKPLEAEGREMLLMVLEGAQLLHFACCPSRAQA